MDFIIFIEIINKKIVIKEKRISDGAKYERRGHTKYVGAEIVPFSAGITLVQW